MKAAPIIQAMVTKAPLVARRMLSLRKLRAVFFAAALTALLFAGLPSPPKLPGAPSDILQHGAAFAVLALLARLAWQEAYAWKIFIGLSAFGGMIELMQAIPALQRDPSFKDWFVDCAAALAILFPTALLPKQAKASLTGRA